MPASADVYLTGYHAAYLGNVGPGKTVTVIGDGAVGLSAVLEAKQLGAEKIILMGRHQVRTNLGRKFGATDVVAERGDEGVAKFLELTNGEGSHVALEAVGLMPAYDQAYGIVRPGGIISRVGVPQYEEDPIGFGSLFGKNAQFFIGQSYLAPLASGSVPVSNVTFEPGCRNNWHVHHGSNGGGHQILLCTAGSGWYQAEGSDPVSLEPGSVVRVRAGTKHWHGAKADSWFSHVAFITPGEGGSNEWLEPVSDEFYAALTTTNSNG